MKKSSPLVRQLPWSHNLIIFSQSKRPEEREFYVRLASSGKMVEARIRTSVQGRTVRAKCDPAGKNLSGAETIPPGSA